MQVVLVMFRADGERRSFSIVRDMTVIGRREDCDLRIPLGDVSRKHCRLMKDGDTLRVEDLGSSNGTFVNGERVQEAELNPGDTLQVGPVVFAVQIDGVPADEELQPFTGAETGAAVSDEHAEVEAAPEQFGYLEPTAQSEAGAAAAPLGELEELEELQPVEADASEDEFAPPEELEPLAETEDVLEEVEAEPESAPAPAKNSASAETRPDDLSSGHLEEFNSLEVIEPEGAPVEIDESEFEIIDEETPAEDSAVNVDIDFGDNKRDQ